MYLSSAGASPIPGERGGRPDPEEQQNSRDEVGGNGIESPTPSTPPTPPGDSGIWVWLGPVIGAVATIIAALITVDCVRRGRWFTLQHWPTSRPFTKSIAT